MLIVKPDLPIHNKNEVGNCSHILDAREYGRLLKQPSADTFGSLSYGPNSDKPLPTIEQSIIELEC